MSDRAAPASPAVSASGRRSNWQAGYMKFETVLRTIQSPMFTESTPPSTGASRSAPRRSSTATTGSVAFRDAWRRAGPRTPACRPPAARPGPGLAVSGARSGEPRRRRHERTGGCRPRRGGTGRCGAGRLPPAVRLGADRSGGRGARQPAFPRRLEPADGAEPSSRDGCATAHVSKRSNAAISRNAAGRTSAVRALDVFPTACWCKRGTMHQGEGEDLGHLQREDATRGSAQWLERAHGRGAHCANCLGSGKRVGGSKRDALRAWLSTEGRLTGVAVADVAAAGRKLSTVGIEASDVNGARAAIDDVAAGAG